MGIAYNVVVATLECFTPDIFSGGKERIGSRLFHSVGAFAHGLAGFCDVMRGVCPNLGDRLPGFAHALLHAPGHALCLVAHLLAYVLNAVAGFFAGGFDAMFHGLLYGGRYTAGFFAYVRCRLLKVLPHAAHGLLNIFSGLAGWAFRLFFLLRSYIRTGHYILLRKGS